MRADGAKGTSGIDDGSLVLSSCRERTRPVRLLRKESPVCKQTVINTLSALWASLPTPKESLRERVRIVYRSGFAEMN